jgi:replicative DNA helicase
MQNKPNYHLPIWSNEAEKIVLGTIILNKNVLYELSDIIDGDDFYVCAHRAIYDGTLYLIDCGVLTNPNNLKEFIEAKGENDELDSLGGHRYIEKLIENLPPTANIKLYAKLIHKKAVLRTLTCDVPPVSAKQTNILKQTKNQIEEIEKQIKVTEKQDSYGIENDCQHQESYADIATILKTVIARTKKLMEQNDPITGIPTGFHALDQILGGLQPSDLVVLGGRPSMGKTSLAMNIVTNAAIKFAAPVAVFSLEMSKEGLMTRLISSLGGIDIRDLRNGNITDDEYKQLVKTTDTLSKSPIYVDDTPSISLVALRAKARRLKMEKNIQLIVIDWLQLMEIDGFYDNHVMEICSLSHGLKALARELNIPVIVVSQLSRNVEERPDKTPILSDLRDSGCIEQDADIVMFLFDREYYMKNDLASQGVIDLIIAKHRNGPIGIVPLTFQKQYTRFENHTNHACE